MTGRLAAIYGVDLAGVGALTAALAVTYALMQLPAGIAVDRLGSRLTGLVAAGGVIAAYALASVTPTFAVGVVARALAGAVTALGFVAGADLARATATGPRGQGLFGGIASAAAGAAVIGVPAAWSVIGWRAPWVTTAAIAAGAVVCLAATRYGGRPSAPAASAVTRWRGLLLDTTLLRLALVHTAAFALGIVTANWTTDLMRQVWRLPPNQARLIAGLTLLTTIVGRPLGGELAHRWPQHAMRVVVVGLLGGATATMLLAIPTVVPIAVLAAGGLGVFAGMPFAVVFDRIQRERADRPGGAIGYANALANLVIVIGTLALGAAIDAGRATGGFLVLAVLWLLPLAVLRSLFATS